MQVNLDGSQASHSAHTSEAILLAEVETIQTLLAGHAAAIRKKRRPLAAVNRIFVVIQTAFIVIGISVAVAGLIVMIAHWSVIIGAYLGITSLILAGVSVFLLILQSLFIAVATMKAGPMSEIMAAAHYQKLEIDFVIDASLNGQAAIEFVRAQTEWQWKRSGRAITFVLRSIFLPLGFSALYAVLGVAKGVPQQLVSLAFPTLIAVALFGIYGVSRFIDVEWHERFEQLLSQAKDMSKARAELSADSVKGEAIQDAVPSGNTRTRIESVWNAFARLSIGGSRQRRPLGDRQM